MKSSKSSKPKSYNKQPRPQEGRSRKQAVVAYSSPVGNMRAPQIGNIKGGLSVTHREFFHNTQFATSNFIANTFLVNPGRASVFPWLSGIAGHYDMYKFRNLEFHYSTRTTTTVPGCVGITFDFDSLDAPPTDQFTALMSANRSSDSPWNSHVCKVNLSGDRLPARYVTTGATPNPYTSASNVDGKTYDLGSVTIFGDGVNSVGKVGIVEVAYTVDLFTPQYPQFVGGACSGINGLAWNNLVGTNNLADTLGILPVKQYNVSTWQFVTRYQGMIVISVVGTGLNMSGYTGGLTSQSGSLDMVNYCINATATLLIWLVVVNAFNGDLYAPQLGAATTVTGCNFYFTGYCPKNQIDGV